MSCRAHRDSDAHGGTEPVAGKLKRFAKAVLNPCGHDLRRLDFPHIVEQYRKLIPAQAGNDVSRPQATIQSARHDFQEMIGD